MSLRRLAVLCVLAGVAACSRTPDRPVAASPTSPSVLTAAPGSYLTAPVPPAGKFDAVFPGRNATFDFLGRLVGVYRDVLRQGPILLYVDTEGQAVWIQELARYIANGCDFTTSVQRVFAQIDGQPAGPLCAPPPSTAIIQFPGRDIVLAFIILLDQKYQQMGRPAIMSDVDREGLVIWILEYLRYSVNGCDHEAASANVLIQITAKAAPPPVCRKPVCRYTPDRNPDVGGGAGTFTVIMFRREGECDWKATSKSSFIKLVTESGTFSGHLTFTIDPNTGPPRKGIILVEWDGGSIEVEVNQSGPSFILTIQMFDFNKSTGETTECDVSILNHKCTIRVVSQLPAGISAYNWSAVYTYGPTTKNVASTASEFVITENCGGTGSTPEGIVAELVITLTATDSQGNTATVTTGQGGHPSKYYRFRSCGT